MVDIEDIGWDLEKSVVENLSRQLGVDLRELIDMPDEESLVEGDRVVFQHRGARFKRKDPSTEDVKDFLEELTAAMDEAVGEGEYEIEFEMPSPPPPGKEYAARMIDVIPDLTWWDERVKYARSSDLLPNEDWRVDWLLGVLFKSSDADMVFLDFRDPKVKVLVAGCFYSMYDTDELEARRREILVSSLRRAKELKRRYQSDPSIKWAKLVFTPDQEGNHKTIVTVMDSDGRLRTTESRTLENP
ncbi:MAG: hypothetical protein ACTSRF_09345 [Candidatus Freyarchaeota archaeon]